METSSFEEDTTNHLLLVEGEPVIVEVEWDQPAYLKYNHEGKNMSIRFTIEGCDSKSDAGVYISTKHIKPKLTNAMVIWTKYGIKRLDFHTTDQLYKEGMYYLWVSGIKKNLNKVRVEVSCFDPIEITEINEFIKEEIGVDKDRFRHHFITIPRADWKRYEIHISPGWPNIAAYLSCKNANLPPEECDWAVGLFKNDDLIK